MDWTRQIPNQTEGHKWSRGPPGLLLIIEGHWGSLKEHCGSARVIVTIGRSFTLERSFCPQPLSTHGHWPGCKSLPIARPLNLTCASAIQRHPVQSYRRVLTLADLYLQGLLYMLFWDVSSFSFFIAILFCLLLFLFFFCQIFHWIGSLLILQSYS